MRPTRVLYVENDSALRRILGEMLGKSKELEILGTYAKSDDVLDRTLVPKADVALIDFSLDQNGLNGIIQFYIQNFSLTSLIRLLY